MGWVICGLALLAFIAVVIITHIAFKRTVSNTRGDDIIEDRVKLPSIWRNACADIRAGRALAASLPHEELRIKSRDGLTLYGLYIPSAQESNITVLCVHGYMMTGLNEFAIYIPMYRKLQVNLLIVDLRAHGKSDGKYISFGYMDAFDINEWCNTIAARNQNQKVILHGISMGAATVDITAGMRPGNVTAVISDCAFANAYDIIRYVVSRDRQVPVFPFVPLINLLNMLLCGFSFKKASAELAVTKADVPFLFIHGDKDRFVPVENVKRLSDACSSEHTTVIVPDATHGASFLRDEARITREIAAFINIQKSRI